MPVVTPVASLSHDMPEMETCSRIPYLPDEVISKILARVPDVESLFLCAVACKPWGRIVADPAFLRRAAALSSEDGGGDRSSLVGFFLQRRTDDEVKKQFIWLPRSWKLPAFVPAPGSSALGSRTRLLTSFLRGGHDVLSGAKPLAARGGLLLLRLSPHPSMESADTDLHLCVCNLLTGKWDLLPPIDAGDLFGGEAPQGYAVLTAADHGDAADPPLQPEAGYSTFFRVFVVGVDRLDGRVDLLALCSGEPDDWLLSILPLPEVEEGFSLHGCRGAEVFNGSAHWLLQDGLGQFATINVRISSGEVSKIHHHHDIRILRGDDSSALLCTSVVDEKTIQKTKLSILLPLRNNRVTMLTLEDEESPIIAEQDLPRRMDAVCAGDKNGNTMLVVGPSYPYDGYLLDLNSGSTTMVEDRGRSLDYKTAVLFDINMVEFMQGRLACVRQ
ncbi:hypothetical protein HU200_005011 [Digitaria exilis]|uniref:F-box domain-containing protein n=1 Tax=Digitaria exilis TaxID=1010633 RepID=A0A835KT76_9POAL|nr:hypothetical protein HU200_005011 [Digitaria exilis]